jgi:hypothetical protein
MGLRGGENEFSFHSQWGKGVCRLKHEAIQAGNLTAAEPIFWKLWNANIQSNDVRGSDRTDVSPDYAKRRKVQKTI